MTKAMPFLQKYDITFLRPPLFSEGVFFTAFRDPEWRNTPGERSAAAKLSPVVCPVRRRGKTETGLAIGKAGVPRTGKGQIRR